MPGRVPLVWSFGSNMMIKLGKLPVRSNSLSSSKNYPRAENVRHVHLEAHGVGAEIGRSDSTVARLADSNQAGSVHEIAIAIQEVGRAALLAGSFQRLCRG